MSGKTDNPMLTQLGAEKVVARSDFEDKARPLNRENYAGAVDVAGGNILANILSMTKAQGELKVWAEKVNHLRVREPAFTGNSIDP